MARVSGTTTRDQIYSIVGSNEKVELGQYYTLRAVKEHDTIAVNTTI